MVNVREMPAIMGHGQLAVRVDAASDNQLMTVVVVVAVIVGVVVFVFHRSVVVGVVAVQHERDAAQRNHERDDLPTVDGFAERQPRRDRTDERCGREDQLTTGRAKFAGSSDPQG